MDNYSQDTAGQYNSSENNNMYKPDSYLVWAILTTFLCCMPFGIVSIVYSTKVDSYWYAGQYSAAYDASHKAKVWAIASAVVGGASVVITFIIMTASTFAPVMMLSSFMPNAMHM